MLADTGRMTLSRVHITALAGLTACLAALAVAIGSERFLAMIPCALCLTERWPYRIGAALGIVALLLPARPARIAAWLMVASLLAGAATAAVHVGVEQHWWPSPLPECAAPRFFGMSAAQRLAAMPARPTKSCEDADYPIAAIPVTYAQANLIYALAVAAGLAISLTTGPRIRGRRPRPSGNFR